VNVCRGRWTHHDIDVLAFVGFHVFCDRTEVPRLERVGIRLLKRTEETIVARALLVTHFKNEGDGISSGSRYRIGILIGRRSGSEAEERSRQCAEMAQPHSSQLVIPFCISSFTLLLSLSLNTTMSDSPPEIQIHVKGKKHLVSLAGS